MEKSIYFFFMLVALVMGVMIFMMMITCGRNYLNTFIKTEDNLIHNEVDDNS